MLTCVQIQFKGYSREIEQQVKQHEAQTLNKLSNVKAEKQRCLEKLVLHIVSFPLIAI